MSSWGCVHPPEEGGVPHFFFYLINVTSRSDCFYLKNIHQTHINTSNNLLGCLFVFLVFWNSPLGKSFNFRQYDTLKYVIPLDACFAKKIFTKLRSGIWHPYSVLVWILIDTRKSRHMFKLVSDTMNTVWLTQGCIVSLWSALCLCSHFYI